MTVGAWALRHRRTRERHRASVPKTDKFVNTPYWQCLAMLDMLFAEGLQRLFSSMPRKYLTLIMGADRPDDVPALKDVAADTP